MGSVILSKIDNNLFEPNIKNITMKKVGIIFAAVVFMGLSSCKKCADCHYDGPNGEEELGEKCGDELKSLEENGISINGNDYVVHCGEDH